MSLPKQQDTDRSFVSIADVRLEVKEDKQVSRKHRRWHEDDYSYEKDIIELF